MSRTTGSLVEVVGTIRLRVIAPPRATCTRLGGAYQNTARQAAQVFASLKEAVLELAKSNPGGVSNSDAASLLGLRSDYGGGSKDYLSYSVLGILMREGKLERSKANKKHVARVE